MTRFLFVIPLILPFVLVASVASAQQGQDACARDVSRFCRAQMDRDLAAQAGKVASK